MYALNRKRDHLFEMQARPSQRIVSQTKKSGELHDDSKNKSGRSLRAGFALQSFCRSLITVIS